MIAFKDYGWNNIDLTKPFTIVIGKRGIGKTVFIESMQKFNPAMQYVEEQQLYVIRKDILKLATKVIEIKEVHNFE